MENAKIENKNETFLAIFKRCAILTIKENSTENFKDSQIIDKTYLDT